MFVSLFMHIYIYIYIYICVCVCIFFIHMSARVCGYMIGSVCVSFNFTRPKRIFLHLHHAAVRLRRATSLFTSHHMTLRIIPGSSFGSSCLCSSFGPSPHRWLEGFFQRHSLTCQFSFFAYSSTFHGSGGDHFELHIADLQNIPRFDGRGPLLEVGPHEIFQKPSFVQGQLGGAVLLW